MKNWEELIDRLRRGDREGQPVVSGNGTAGHPEHRGAPRGARETAGGKAPKTWSSRSFRTVFRRFQAGEFECEHRRTALVRCCFVIARNKVYRRLRYHNQECRCVGYEVPIAPTATMGRSADREPIRPFAFA